MGLLQIPFRRAAPKLVYLWLLSTLATAAGFQPWNRSPTISTVLYVLAELLLSLSCSLSEKPKDTAIATHAVFNISVPIAHLRLAYRFLRFSLKRTSILEAR